MMTCPHCGERVPTNNFCDMCGRSLQHYRVEQYATVAVVFAADYSALTLHGVTQGQYWHSDFIKVE